MTVILGIGGAALRPWSAKSRDEAARSTTVYLVPTDQKHADPSRLPSASRWFCGVLGAGAFSAGGASVFVTSNGTGGAALIAAGLLLGLVGAAGRLPTKGSFGGVDYDLSERIVERAFDELPQDAREQVAEIAVTEAKPSALAAAAGRRLWHHDALDAVRRVAPDGTEVRDFESQPDHGYDAVLSDGSANVFIELRHGRRLETQQQQLMRLLRSMRTGPGRHLLVTATPQPVTEGLHVVWRGRDDDDVLAAALLAALTSARDAT